MSEFQEICISDVILSANTGLDAIKRAPIVLNDTGIKCLRIQDVSQEKKFEDWGFTNVEERNFYKFQLKKNDIIVARTGASIGVNKIIEENSNAVFNNGLIRIRVNENLCDSKYLFYNFRTSNYNAYIDSISGGTSTQPNMQINALLRYEISLPPIPTQKAIAHILGSLDDKIELLRQMNETLEAMARALFKSWFVDFDPVRKKADGLPTGLPKEVEDMFPSEFVDSELGEIPKGWKVGKLGDYIQILDLKRIPLSGAERAKRKGTYPYHGATSIMDYVDDFIFEGIFVLLGEDGSVIKEDSTPFVQYVWGKIWVNNHAHVLLGNGISNEHLKVFLEQVNISAFVNGAVQAKLNQENMKKIPFIFSSNSINKAYGNLINNWFEIFRSNFEQIQTLVTIRDSLLPKLISGELELSDNAISKILEPAK
ncbi:MAG: restriction endonuclease subunit S [Leptospira sp.]|nr:restriction endonuclease subunit S [Leptospira sp.]